MPEHRDTVNPDLTPPNGESTSAPTREAAPETMPSMEELLRKAELQGAEHYDAWLRAKADAENIRRRAQEDIAKAHKFAVEAFSSEMLAVRDSLAAALAVQNATVESMKSGVEITARQLDTVFERFAIREIDPVGEKFDPHRHQAMSAVEADAPPNTVVQVFQKGYLLHERVLRPALVAVAKARES
ncbi:MAG: nucleotide exchange factor GrpE [Betaproteobacteria bacterium]